ncbi:MAG: hypothetical protein ACJARY_002253, partial [Candidatus Azotimanducaceae bacterium]
RIGVNINGQKTSPSVRLHRLFMGKKSQWEVKIDVVTRAIETMQES